jgi:integrase
MNKSNGSRRIGAAPTDKTPGSATGAADPDRALKRALQHPAINPQRGPIGRRGQRSRTPCGTSCISTRAVSTHTFHSCATHMLRAGAPIRHLQDMLGHASIETPQIYTRATTTDLRAAHRRFHPREQRAAKLTRRTTRRIRSLRK